MELLQKANQVIENETPDEKRKRLRKISNDALSSAIFITVGILILSGFMIYAIMENPQRTAELFKYLERYKDGENLELYEIGGLIVAVIFVVSITFQICDYLRSFVKIRKMEKALSQNQTN